MGKQRLSIGKNCDRLGTVEHEFLHALGFWHEQSRADRDDYVDIMWDRIEPGNELQHMGLQLKTFHLADMAVLSTINHTLRRT